MTSHRERRQQRRTALGTARRSVEVLAATAVDGGESVDTGVVDLAGLDLASGIGDVATDLSGIDWAAMHAEARAVLRRSRLSVV